MKEAAVQLTIAQLRKIATTADSAASVMGWQEQYPNVDTYKIPPPPSETDPLITRGDKWQPSARLLHIHNYWHRYLAALMAIFAFSIGVFFPASTNGPRSLLSTLFMGGLIGSIVGGIIWGALAFFRSKIQDVSNIHTIAGKSNVFKLGAGLGLAFYLYTNGIPSFAVPEELTRQHARVILWGGITLLAEIYGGGKILELLANRFLGYDPEDDEDKDEWGGAAY